MKKPINEKESRYDRQILLSGFGEEGQKKMAAASVFIVGLGGLGNIAALYLAGAGVGRIGLADPDRLQPDNLPRQVIYRENELGELKVELAALRLREHNSKVKTETFPLTVNKDNFEELAGDYDVILDAADNFAAKYMLNEQAVKNKKTLIHAGAVGYEGLVTTVVPGLSPCYRCIFPQRPPENYFPTSRENGILGALAGILGLIQAAEAVKSITGLGRNLCGRLLRVNALEMRFEEMEFKRDPLCPVCGSKGKKI